MTCKSSLFFWGARKSTSTEKKRIPQSREGSAKDVPWSYRSEAQSERARDNRETERLRDTAERRDVNSGASCLGRACRSKVPEIVASLMYMMPRSVSPETCSSNLSEALESCVYLSTDLMKSVPEV